ncbi:MAG: cysteine desulfurase family protein [Nitrospiraceae bacterium]|nr:cysteine desulfurase family protein [Nitrospiraceae bacterium]
MQRIYLDYNASTPIAPAVLDAMMPYLTTKYGNPSSSHSFGVDCRAGLEQARERLANLLGCEASEVFFTSGATESNNTVIKGLAKAAGKGKHFITSAFEHPAVLEPMKNLERFRYAVTYLPVDRYGLIDPADLEKAIRPETVLVSVMHANNEVGTIQDIASLAKIAKAKNVLFHTDAAQSVGKIAAKVDALGVDFLTVAGHKFYAPKGVGALYIRQGRKVPPLMLGAGHERGMRPGTENLASIVGLGAAAELAMPILESEGQRQRKLGQRLFDGLRQAGFQVHLNGHPEKRLPNTWSIAFEGYDTTEVMEALGRDIAVSAGAACHGDQVSASHVLVAMGVPETLSRGTIRFSLGRETTEAEIDEVVQRLKERLKVR